MKGFHIMGMGPSGLVWLAGGTAFIAYLSRAFTGPADHPKFQTYPELADMAKASQPGIIPELYYHPKKKLFQ